MKIVCRFFCVYAPTLTVVIKFFVLVVQARYKRIVTEWLEYNENNPIF